tara:strand:+ start:607 stop:894 length:288 start_codon:yes stop_codon:yes gene_type:complete
MARFLVIVFMCCVLTSCSTQTFQFANSLGKLKKEKMQNFFIYGLGQEQEINPITFCGSVSRITKVEVKQTFMDGLLMTLSFGIFTPRTAYVYCKK